MNPSTSSTSAPPSLLLPASLPPLPQHQHQDEQQTKKGTQACLQVLQAATALLPMHVQGLCQSMREEKTQGRDEGAAATHILRTLRDTLDHVLGDGASSDGAKRKRVGPAEDSNISTAPATACAQVLQRKPGHLLTTIVGWLFHEHHTLPSGGAGPSRTCQLGMVPHQPTVVLLAAACRRTFAFSGSER